MEFLKIFGIFKMYPRIWLLYHTNVQIYLDNINKLVIKCQIDDFNFKLFSFFFDIVDNLQGFFSILLIICNNLQLTDF